MSQPNVFPNATFPFEYWSIEYWPVSIGGVVVVDTCGCLAIEDETYFDVVLLDEIT